MKSFFRHIIIAILLSFVLTAFHAFLMFFQGNEITTEFVLTSLKYNAYYAIPFYMMNALAHGYARGLLKKSSWKPWKFWLAYSGIIVISNIILATLLSFGINLMNGKGIEIDIMYVLSAALISLVIASFFYIYFYLKHKFDKKSAQQQEKVIRVTQSHDALKSQIGPHFLFNSLNVLSGLVDENPDKAQDFIADLAQVYRYVLDQKDKDWVPLSEEIHFAETYLELVKTRFENGLEIIIQPDLNDSAWLIAPLTLQLLLENCVKHNSVGAHHPLQIKIYTENAHLVVENNLNPKKTLSNRKGTGLQNIQNRYQSIGKNLNIQKTTHQFMVSVPLLTQNQIKMNAQQQFTDEEMRLAREEVRERIGFFGNLSAYVVVCSVFVIINLWQGGYFWAIWPIIGWGTGVLFHGLGVFVFGKKSVDGNSWEDRQARKLLERRKGN